MDARIAFTLLMLMTLCTTPDVVVASRQGLDARIVARLAQSGDRIERPGVVVYAERDALAPETLSAFSDDASLAVAGIRDYLGSHVQLRGGDDERAVEFYLSRDAGISHASPRQPRTFMVPSRIANETAPYVHEAVHAMAAWSGRSQWISEGFADHVSARVVARVGGYHFVPVEPRGVGTALAHLRSDHGRAVLPLVGAIGSRADVAVRYPEVTARIRTERRTYAAAFYTLSWSFVDYLVAQVGIDGLRAIAEANGEDDAVIAATGRSLQAWKSAWLQQLERAKRRGCPVSGSTNVRPDATNCSGPSKSPASR